MNHQTTRIKGLTRTDALRELQDVYASLAECRERYERIGASQHGYIGRQAALEDVQSDTEAYSERAQQLEAFLRG